MAEAGPSTPGPNPVAKGENVKYTAVVRAGDRVPIATYAAVSNREIPESLMEDKLDRLLGSGRISEKSRLTITDKDVGSIHYDSGPDYLFLVICDREYPQRTAFKFLADLGQFFGQRFGEEGLQCPPFGLSGPAKPLLKDLCSEYNVIENVDKITGVQTQVDDVKNVMQSNISNVLQNQENLNVLLDKSDAMRNEANAFSRNAGSAKKKFWWQNVKLMIIIGVLVAVLIAIIVGAVLKAT
ncbi:hypothetical protein NDN08_002607 [Rhodosorus marinus]|uniref:V-SNARE coiled-coil homology domain-containing protein n=1 Tax=Rhodosorus marinus TaxID=101924 RepID=A0AAV8UU91_9RHOD|nr:hypothetical protein NDN08_002607 [Rhodosorus marinus]